MSGIVDKLLENAKIVNKNINIMKETIERHSPRDIDLECNIDNKGNLINSDISDSITIQILKSKQLIGVKGGSIPKINKLNYEAILNFKNSLCVLEKCHLKEDFDNFYYSLLNDLKVVKKNCEYLKKAFPESEKSVIRTGFGIDSYIGGITELEKGVPF